MTVTTLLDKLRQSEDFEGKEDYLARLTAARQEIAAIQAEIDSINADVREKLYPLKVFPEGQKDGGQHCGAIPCAE